MSIPMTPDQIRTSVRTYRYKDAVYVVIDSLPQPFLESFWQFLRGSAIPVGDGKNRYAYTVDFERWLEAYVELLDKQG